jgi:hypothetical protein
LGADDTTFRADISPRRAAPLTAFTQYFKSLGLHKNINVL